MRQDRRRLASAIATAITTATATAVLMNLMMCICCDARAQAHPDSLDVRYDVDAFLVAPKRQIDGSLVVTLRNRADVAVAEVAFVLDANRVHGGRPVIGARTEDEDEGSWSGIDIYAVKVVETHADLATLTRIDGSRMDVRLPEPLNPGMELKLRIHFVTHLPPMAASSTRPGRGTFFISGWYPRIAGLGDYRVQFVVPDAWHVGSTGAPLQEAVSLGDGGKRVFLGATGVRDFAVIAGPGLITGAEPVAVDDDIVAVRYVAAEAWRPTPDQVMGVADRALRFLAGQLGVHPEGTVTLASLPFDRDSFGDRPGILRLPGHRLRVSGDLRIERAVIEGMARQLFEAGVIQPGESRLAGGISRFLGDQYFEGRFGQQPPVELQAGVTALAGLVFLDRGLGMACGPASVEIAAGPVVLSPLRHDLARLIGRRDRTESGVPRWSLVGSELPAYALGWSWLRPAGASAARLRYLDGRRDAADADRQALVLETLSRHIGFEQMAAALRDHALALRGGVVGNPDEALVDAVRRHAAAPLDSLIEQLVDRPGEVDFAIAEISVETGRGPVYSEQERPGDFRDRRDDAGLSSRTRVVVRQNGWVRLPADVLFTFADGSEQRRRFSGEEPVQEFVFEGGPTLTRAVVDPDHVYALDMDWNNNGRSPVPAERTSRKLAANLVFWLQTALHALSSIS